VSDSSLTDKAAAAVDDATDTAAKVADDVKAQTAKTADAVTSETGKAADTATSQTAKAAETAKVETAKAADSVKAGTTKAADTVKSEAGKVADKVADATDGTADTPATPPPPRSMDEIEAELEATRERLAGRIDDLTEYVKPANVVERQKNKLKSVFVDEYGGIKPDRVLIAAGIVVAVVGLSVLRRRRRRS